MQHNKSINLTAVYYTLGENSHNPALKKMITQKYYPRNNAAGSFAIS